MILLEDHIFWMQRCLALAKQAMQQGEAEVGAVLVGEEGLVLEASEAMYSVNNVTGHAELIVIKKACQLRGSLNLSNCILYTNVEPCWMCSYAIRETKIGTVVIGRPVSEIGGVTSPFTILTTTTNSDWSAPPNIIWLNLGEDEQRSCSSSNG